MTVLAIDIGSSSVRAILCDTSARPIPGARAVLQHEFDTFPAGAAVTNALELRRKVEKCIDDVLAHPAADGILGVGIAAFTSSLVGVDRSGHPITPVVTYADTRSASDVEDLAQQIDVIRTLQRTGCRNHSTYLPGRLRWLRRTDPLTYLAVDRWLDIGAYLFNCWFGQPVTSYSLASWSGLLNREKLSWDEEWLAILELREDSLPLLGDYDDLVMELRDDYAGRWPELRRTSFCRAISDGAAANVGSGGVDREHIVLTVGTTAAVRVITDESVPELPAGLWGYRLDSSYHVIGGATFEGGNIFHWATRVLAVPADAELESLLQKRKPGVHGLSFLPLLAGERSPGWLASATGAILGLRLSTDGIDILQAALEGVAIRLSLTLNQLRPIAAASATLMAGGGALTASLAWTQMIADACDCTLHIVREKDVTARGTAIMVLRALGVASLTGLPPAIDRRVEPIPEHVAYYRDATAVQKRLYDTAADLIPHLK